MGLIFRLRRGVRRAKEIRRARQAGGPVCGHCGFAGAPLRREVIWPELAQSWGLTAQWLDWMNDREGSRCAWCGASRRAGELAAAIVEELNARCGVQAGHLKALMREAAVRRLSIAEINSAGNLHRTLARCPGLRYSEYGSGDPAVPSEDLSRLSYADASFDLVVTSDTLEHVPDIDAALRETRRVLVPGACHVFTVPVVWGRPTRQRAEVVDGAVRHLLPPSYHGTADLAASDFLVFNEFGDDFVDRCRAAGFDLQLRRDAHNPALVTFIARRPAA